jgi:hypothetical protein
MQARKRTTRRAAIDRNQCRLDLSDESHDAVSDGTTTRAFKRGTARASRLQKLAQEPPQRAFGSDLFRRTVREDPHLTL